MIERVATVCAYIVFYSVFGALYPMVTFLDWIDSKFRN